MQKYKLGCRASLLALLWVLVPFARGIGQTAPAATVLHPGDVIKLGVWREPALSGDFAVAANGAVSHPLYQELIVAGKPLAEVREAFRQLLSRFTATPQFVLEVLVPISIDGEVRRPNVYNLSPITTVAQVVSLAGGATERGKAQAAHLYRDGRDYIVDLSRPNEGLSATQIQSGDHVFVPRASSVFRDYIAPAAAVAAALASVINILAR